MPRPLRRPKQIKASVSIEVYDALLRLAELNEMSLSGCVGDMFDSLLPGIKHTIMLMEESLKLNAEAKAGLAKALSRHEEQLKQTVDYVQENTENEVRQYKLPMK